LQIEAGKAELHTAAVSIGAFLRGIADIIRVKAEEKGLVFALALPHDLPQTVEADEKRLRQVLLNLLGNAVKFTDAGHVQLAVRRLAGTTVHARLRFEVRDTGVGIGEEQREAIFDPFHQAGDMHRRAAGTGLGLAISRQLAHLMGSDIHLDSCPGAGSCFWFELTLPVLGHDGVAPTAESC